MSKVCKFRKRPVIVEAIQWDKTSASANKIGSWCSFTLRNGELEIFTLEGVMKANEGDWIIKGVKNEVYPCKPDIFEMTYESVTPARRRKNAED